MQIAEFLHFVNGGETVSLSWMIASSEPRYSVRLDSVSFARPIPHEHEVIGKFSS
jgi:hypothetical protein